MKKGIIFDLDGTLWDSVDSVATSWNIGAKKILGVDLSISREVLGGFMGKTMDQFLPIFGDVSKEKAQEALDYCMEYELEYLRQVPGILFPKVRETLAKLSKKYPLYIVSNCQVGYIETFLETMNMKEIFLDFEDYGRTGLPKGRNIQILMERVKLDEAIYVGDTQGDYEATILAQIPFVFAEYGFGQVDNANQRIQSFEQLLGIL